MSRLIDSIVDRNFVEADSIISEAVELIMAKKLEEAKKMCAAKIEEQPHAMNRSASDLVRKDIVEDEEDKIEEGVIQVPLRGGGKTNVPVQGSVVNQSVSGATINKTGTSPVSSAEREPVGSGDRMSVNKAVSLTQKPDPIGQRQAALHAGNAKAAVRGGYSPRYMPSDPDFTQRAAAARAKSANMGGGAVGSPNLREEEQLDEARIKVVKARVRGGKIQRRKKVSNVPGMTVRAGKLQRMSAAERRRRKLGAKRAVRKRIPKMNRALMKRKRSLMKRRSLGL